MEKEIRVISARNATGPKRKEKRIEKKQKNKTKTKADRSTVQREGEPAQTDADEVVVDQFQTRRVVNERRRRRRPIRRPAPQSHPFVNFNSILFYFFDFLSGAWLAFGVGQCRTRCSTTKKEQKRNRFRTSWNRSRHSTPEKKAEKRMCRDDAATLGLTWWDSQYWDSFFSFFLFSFREREAILGVDFGGNKQKRNQTKRRTTRIDQQNRKIKRNASISIKSSGFWTCTESTTR